MLKEISMKRLLVLIVLLLPCLAMAVGNPKVGHEKAATCRACHGLDGNSPLEAWPNIAGQNESYLIYQLNEFKKGPKGQRDNDVMYGIMQDLSEQDIQDIAAYFAEQKPKIGQAKASLVKQGEQLYRAGDKKQGIPACIACHGPQGRGINSAKFPALGGQYAMYTVSQLKAYKDGSRTTGGNHIMNDIAKKMDEQQMQAVASYLQGLH